MIWVKWITYKSKLSLLRYGIFHRAQVRKNLKFSYNGKGKIMEQSFYFSAVKHALIHIQVGKEFPFSFTAKIPLKECILRIMCQDFLHRPPTSRSFFPLPIPRPEPRLGCTGNASPVSHPRLPSAPLFQPEWLLLGTRRRKTTTDLLTLLAKELHCSLRSVVRNNR